MTRLSAVDRARQEAREVVAEANSLLAASGLPQVECARAPERLSIALMGRYNAGKSTIANALLGERLAATGDRPETKLRRTYDWRGFRLVDLPGTDARIADQREVEDALTGAHAVLYVVSSRTGFDGRGLWDDLLVLEERHVPCLLVVNDKQAHQTTEGEQAFREAVLANFDKLAHQHLGRSHTVFWVRAKEAELARTGGRPELEAHSRIEPLEEALIAALTRNDPLLRDGAALQPLADALARVEAGLRGDLAAGETQELARMLEDVGGATQTLIDLSQVVAQECFGGLADHLAARMDLAARCEAADRDGVVNDLEALIDAQLETAGAAFGKQAAARIGALAGALGGHSVEPGEPRLAGSVRLGDIPGWNGEGADWRKVRDNIAESAKRAIGFMEAAALAGQRIYAELPGAGGIKAISAGGKAAREVARAGSSTATVMARTAQVVGVVMVAVEAGIEIAEGFAAAEREKAAMVSVAKASRAQADIAANSARHVFLAAAAELVFSNLGPLAGEIRKGLGVARRAERSTAGKLGEVSALRGRIGQVRAALRTHCRWSHE